MREAEALGEHGAARLQSRGRVRAFVHDHVTAHGFLALGHRPKVQVVDLAVPHRVQGFEGGSWTGLFAPKGTPEDVVRILNAEVKKILDRNKETGTLFVEGLQVPRSSTPEELGALLREDVATWRRIAQEVGIKPE